MRNAFAVLGLAMVLGGCGGAPLPPKPPAIEGIVDDKFEAQIAVKGVPYQSDFWHEGIIITEIKVQLVSFIDRKTAKVQHALDFFIDYPPPRRNYLYASDATAKSLPVVRMVAKRTSNMDENEDLRIPFEEADLKAIAAKGDYDIKIRAQQGDPWIITIHPVDVNLQLEAVNKIVADLKQAKTNPASLWGPVQPAPKN